MFYVIETGSYLLLIWYTSCYEAGTSLFCWVLICISSFLHRAEFIVMNPNVDVANHL
ncbi:hypothetical protein Goklo_017280 [Gossypium klotzschianum]|uniref:Uncharacterized protein n=1 Tax=Gossypium klotzschianum TaxID=34286 RepID=A0A7J8UH93_9ROSI|nr:hypothetical protein [Gossypium klotzschianum]